MTSSGISAGLFFTSALAVAAAFLIVMVRCVRAHRCLGKAGGEAVELRTTAASAPASTRPFDWSADEDIYVDLEFRWLKPAS